MVSPQAKREAVSMLMTERDYGVTRACGLMQISRSLYRYRSRRPGCAKLCERITGKPNENAYIGSFNGKFRDECLNEHWFITMAQSRRIIEAWRVESTPSALTARSAI
jgi:hypothetical protein